MKTKSTPVYPFKGQLAGERKRKVGSRCKCCSGKINRNNHCYCKTILD